MKTFAFGKRRVEQGLGAHSCTLIKAGFKSLAVVSILCRAAGSRGCATVDGALCVLQIDSEIARILCCYY